MWTDRDINDWFSTWIKKSRMRPGEPSGESEDPQVEELWSRFVVGSGERTIIKYKLTFGQYLQLMFVRNKKLP